MSARFLARGSVAVAAGLAGLIAGIIPAAGLTASRHVPALQVSRISDISGALPGQNAEVEEAADPTTDLSTRSGSPPMASASPSQPTVATGSRSRCWFRGRMAAEIPLSRWVAAVWSMPHS
jgi:hypothetical protein